MLDEAASAGRENLDADHASRYDSKEDAGAADEVRRCQEPGLTRRSLVVEFGTGTGQFALAVAPACQRVVAVDVSPVMLKALRHKIDRSTVGNIEVVEAGFLTYQHRGDPADFVYSRFALHHLPDFWKAIALTKIHEILRPGGVVRLWDVVFGFDPTEAGDRIEAWCSTGDVTVDEGWSRSELEEHVRDEHSTFTWLLEPMMQRCGFAIEEAEFSGDGIFAKYILRRC
jgi:ubiquinone/menaquinone biosynthesis C-methylase UbiE